MKGLLFLIGVVLTIAACHLVLSANEALNGLFCSLGAIAFYTASSDAVWEKFR